VLAASRAVSPRAEREGIVDRIWESRGARWGWALLVSALILGHVAVSKTGDRDGLAVTQRGSPPDLGTEEAALFPAELWLQQQPHSPRVREVERLNPDFVKSLLEETQ
jgi:hypothetical protein